MIKSANQQYKESKSQIPFKEWLSIEQDNGRLLSEEKMYNASGVNEEVKSSANSTKTGGMRMADIVGLISAGMFAYGVYQETKK
jgi:hypothetical protein